MLYLAASYVENDKRSYRETASPGGRVRGYQTPTSAPAIDERALAQSTLWWMLAWMGAQVAALAKGRQLVQQHHPSSTCHRFVGAVSPDKFRSRQRELSLCRSRQLLHLRAEWEDLFPEKFFPRFATRSGFR